MKASEIGWRLPKDRDVKWELLECPRDNCCILLTLDLGMFEAESLRRDKRWFGISTSKYFFFPDGTAMVMGEQEYNEE
jgi:hypothetical protein